MRNRPMGTRWAPGRGAAQTTPPQRGQVSAKPRGNVRSSPRALLHDAAPLAIGHTTSPHHSASQTPCLYGPSREPLFGRVCVSTGRALSPRPTSGAGGTHLRTPVCRFPLSQCWLDSIRKRIKPTCFPTIVKVSCFAGFVPLCHCSLNVCTRCFGARAGVLVCMCVLCESDHTSIECLERAMVLQPSSTRECASTLA